MNFLLINNPSSYPFKKFIWAHPKIHLALKKLYRHNPIILISVHKLRYWLFSLINRTSHRDLLQLPNKTWMDRRVNLFKKVLQEFNFDDKELRILSFGCSTGEEVFTLRKFFKHAIIFGTDINRSCIKEARRHNLDSQITFFISDRKRIRRNGPYDVIFANSVFIKNPECDSFDRIDKLFPFDTFERWVKVLDESLVEGGLLILYLTNYKFSDTTIYKNYEIIHDNSIIEERVPIFNKSGQKIQNEHYDDVIFKKITHHKFDISN